MFSQGLKMSNNVDRAKSRGRLNPITLGMVFSLADSPFYSNGTSILDSPGQGRIKLLSGRRMSGPLYVEIRRNRKNISSQLGEKYGSERSCKLWCRADLRLVLSALRIDKE
jgi:hypothetical protein